LIRGRNELAEVRNKIIEILKEEFPDQSYDYYLLAMKRILNLISDKILEEKEP
jgi:hypothetical protein